MFVLMTVLFIFFSNFIQTQHTSLDNPEMSMLISKVGDALKVVSEVLGNIEGIKQLPEVIPEILQLVRQMKSQKVKFLEMQEIRSQKLKKILSLFVYIVINNKSKKSSNYHDNANIKNVN